MRSGDLVMLEYRWSWKSLHIGLLLQKKDGDFWVILWNDGQNLSIEEYHEDSIVTIDDHNLEKASSRWNIAGS
jgi:hypothetical protein